MESTVLDVQGIQRMLFIYNAVQNGWTVRKMSDGKFEFKKKKDSELLEIRESLMLSDNNEELDLTHKDYLFHFINTNKKVDTLIKK